MSAATQKPIMILIADDHPIVRSGLRAVLEKSAGMSVVHEADNGDTAMQLLRQSKPDVVILDVEMPLMDGFTVAKLIHDEGISVQVIIMTMHNDEQTFNRAMDIGVNGFVLKENAVVDIVNAVHVVMEGKHFISPQLSDYLMQRTLPSAQPTMTAGDLTPTEKNILRLIADQKTTRTIADELFISPKTVEKHRSNICAKLNLHGAYALLKFAMENKGR